MADKKVRQRKPDKLKKELAAKETEKKVKLYEKQYSEGLITRGEKYNKVVDAWAKCSDNVAEEMTKIMVPKSDEKVEKLRKMVK